MDPYLNPALSEVLVPAQETGSSWPKSTPCSCLVLNKLNYYRAERQQLLHSDGKRKGAGSGLFFFAIGLAFYKGWLANLNGC